MKIDCNNVTLNGGYEITWAIFSCNITGIGSKGRKHGYYLR